MTINIFLSYGNDDKNKKDALKRAIKKQKGLNPIVVADRRSPGKLLEEKVKEGIFEADYIVPIFTNSSIGSQWVNQEIGFAEALEKIIWPIVEKSMLDELKGFYHKNRDLPYSFDHNKDSTKEADGFRKCYNALLEDILKLEKIKSHEQSPEVSQNLEITKLHGYKAKDIPIEKEITDKTAFNLRVKLFSKEQIFRAYYLFETDKNESKWVGYTNKKSAEHITDGENTIALNDSKKSLYAINDNISSTINERFSDLNGTPIKVKHVRFRGDKLDSREINYYYGFSEEP